MGAEDGIEGEAMGLSLHQLNHYSNYRALNDHLKNPGFWFINVMHMLAIETIFKDL